MGGWSGLVRFGAGADGVAFKSLLRTGFVGNFQYWVGGDRAAPFGPLPTLTTSNEFVEPRTIMATGPGLDDWVVCYHSVVSQGQNLGGPNLAFANSTGIIKTRVITFPAGPNPFLVVTSKGNFASYRVGTDDQDDIEQGWSSLLANESGRVGVEFGSISNFVLPDAFVSLYGVSQQENLSTFTAIDPTLSHALHRRNSGSDPRLYIGSSSSVVLSPSFTPFQPSRFFALINLVLHQSGTFTEDEIGGAFPVAVDRWQIAEDGTWATMDAVTGRYTSASGYNRVDLSFHVPA